MEINYTKLREYQRQVRDSPELTALPEDFYEQTMKYLKNLDERCSELNSTDSVFAEDAVGQVKSELNNARQIVRDIYERRERKILTKALSLARTKENITPLNLLRFELDMYKRIWDSIFDKRQGVLHTVINGHCDKPAGEEAGNDEVTEQKALKTKPILITEDTQSFIWEDGQTYGPYKQGEAVQIPEELAQFMIINNKANEK